MKKRLAWILWICWLIIIFYLSHQSGEVSGGTSSNLIYNTLEFVMPIFKININIVDIVSFIHNPLREVMHIIEYFILALLTFNLLKQYNNNKKIFITISFCFIYAVFDEIHQLFIVGRTLEYIDIFMDIVGTIIGCILYQIIKTRNKL